MNASKAKGCRRGNKGLLTSCVVVSAVSLKYIQFFGVFSPRFTCSVISDRCKDVNLNAWLGSVFTRFCYSSHIWLTLWEDTVARTSKFQLMLKVSTGLAKLILIIINKNRWCFQYCPREKGFWKRVKGLYCVGYLHLKRLRGRTPLPLGKCNDLTRSKTYVRVSMLFLMICGDQPVCRSTQLVLRQGAGDEKVGSPEPFLRTSFSKLLPWSE